MARRTYAQAHEDILKLLKAEGWRMSKPLKIPHATSPDGELRLWFKSQAIYYTDVDGWQGKHDFSDARSLHADIRKHSAEESLDWVKRKFL